MRAWASAKAARRDVFRVPASWLVAGSFRTGQVARNGAGVLGCALKHAGRDQLLDDLLHGAVQFQHTLRGEDNALPQLANRRTLFVFQGCRQADEVDADDATGDVHLTHAIGKNFVYHWSSLRFVWFGPLDLAHSLSCRSGDPPRQLRNT